MDLDTPGALDRLKQENPEHYQAVRQILASAAKFPEGVGDAGYLQVTYDAEDVCLSPVLLASNPPKRDLSFRLDDVQYHRLITLAYVSALAQPAVSRPKERPR